jgi:hypothetical protein
MTLGMNLTIKNLFDKVPNVLPKGRFFNGQMEKK